jgi:hypothetical protein
MKFINVISAASISAADAPVSTANALPVPKVAIPESRLPLAHAPVVSITRLPRQRSAAAFVASSSQAMYASKHAAMAAALALMNVFTPAAILAWHAWDI